MLQLAARMLTLVQLALLPQLADANSPLPKSRALLEQRVQELKDESRQLSNLRPELLKLQDQLKQAQQCAETLRPPAEADAAKVVAELRSAWARVVAAKPATILDAGHAEYDALDAAYRGSTSLYNVLGRCTEPFVAQMRREFDRFLGEPGRANPKVSALVNQYLQKHFEADFLLRRDPIGRFLGEYAGEAWPRSRLSQTTSQSIAGAIDSLAKVTNESSRKIEDFRSSMKELGSAIDREMEATKTRSDEIDKSLTELDDRLSVGTAATDRQLILAVYMMIGALLILFLGIKFLNGEVALKIVENRSLVEVVSMAFLLLTIIILGTGEKMQKEAIGTLLGSIAGYIFGRKISENR